VRNELLSPERFAVTASLPSPVLPDASTRKLPLLRMCRSRGTVSECAICMPLLIARA